MLPALRGVLKCTAQRSFGVELKLGAPKRIGDNTTSPCVLDEAALFKSVAEGDERSRDRGLVHAGLLHRYESAASANACKGSV